MPGPGDRGGAWVGAWGRSLTAGRGDAALHRGGGSAAVFQQTLAAARNEQPG